MAFIARIKTWGAEKLNFADLNAEFDNVISGTKDGTKDANVAACNVNGIMRAKGDVYLGDNTTDTLTIVANIVAPTTNIAVNVVTANVINVTTLQLGGVDISTLLLPIGSIIYHYDFDGAFTPDANIWASCNGQTKNVGGLGDETLPDLSGRYIVGFGTDGGADMASATWATDAVGQAGHTSASIQHNHQVNPAAVTSASPNTTSITGGSHNHGISPGVAWARIYFDAGENIQIDRDTSVSSWASDYAWAAGNTSTGVSASYTGGVNLDGATDTDSSHDHTYDHTHTVDVGLTTSTNSLTTISIQPRSVRCRAYMRVM